MTLTEIEKLDTDFLTPAQICGVLGCQQYNINLQARENPGGLGFPVILIRNRVKIPREAFIRYMKGELQPPKAECADCRGDNLEKQLGRCHKFCKSCGRRLPLNENVS